MVCLFVSGQVPLLQLPFALCSCLLLLLSLVGQQAVVEGVVMVVCWQLCPQSLWVESRQAVLLLAVGWEVVEEVAWCRLVLLLRKAHSALRASFAASLASQQHLRLVVEVEVHPEPSI